MGKWAADTPWLIEKSRPRPGVVKGRTEGVAWGSIMTAMA